MTYFCLSMRNIKTKKGKKYFAADPGRASFLICGEAGTIFAPSQRIIGKGNQKHWAAKVIDAASGERGEGDIVFFVHGYNVDAQSAFKTHKILQSRLAQHGLEKAALVSYDWPARGSFLNYLEDDSDARATAIDLVRAGISLSAKYTKPECRMRVHVMAHSMGALVVREAFRAAAGHSPTREAAWGVTQLILFGADISSRSIAGPDSVQLFHHAQRITNYFNRHDTALATSNAKRFMSSPRLGRHGAPKEMLDKIVDIDVTDRWKRVSDQLTDSCLEEHLLSHSFYFSDDVWIKDVVETLKGDVDRRHILTRSQHHEEGRLRLNTENVEDLPAHTNTYKLSA